MIWLLEGYGPKRFAFATLRGFRVARKFARVWKARDGCWNWTTYRDRSGWAPDMERAKAAAENEIRYG